MQMQHATPCSPSVVQVAHVLTCSHGSSFVSAACSKQIQHKMSSAPSASSSSVQKSTSPASAKHLCASFASPTHTGTRSTQVKTRACPNEAQAWRTNHHEAMSRIKRQLPKLLAACLFRRLVFESTAKAILVRLNTIESSGPQRVNNGAIDARIPETHTCS